MSARLRIATGAVAAAGTAAALWLAAGDGSEPRRASAASPSAGAAIATVTRQTLVNRETVDGVLRHADSRTLGNRLPGTLTSLAAPGTVVRRGGVLYRVDELPVVLMYGRLPAYRSLSERVEDGQDVRQLEANLSALGFYPGMVDEEFTSTTADAVRDWQEANGLHETGIVELGRIVFLPGARRIGERMAEVGQQAGPGQELMDTTSVRRAVWVELDVALQALVERGDRVEVTLPSGRTVRGRVASVGRVARDANASATGEGDGGASEDHELVIDVRIVLRSQRGMGRLDQAPVSVGIARESRRRVLSVPVEALLARRGGGYAVELARGRTVRVRTGLFASGLVEISSPRIRAGDRVVVPE